MSGKLGGQIPQEQIISFPNQGNMPLPCFLMKPEICVIEDSGVPSAPCDGENG